MDAIPQETHRAATPLELLFDLTFANSFGLAASEVASVVPATVLLIGSLGIAWARRGQLASVWSRRS